MLYQFHLKKKSKKKGIAKQMKMQVFTWEKVRVSHIFDKGLISRIYITLKKKALITDEMNNPI
jgi:hypothetical protein